MLKLFNQTANLSMNKAIRSDFFQKLPERIRQHTDWDFSCQQTERGYFLKPTFRNMPYRNAFVPEIDIVISCCEERSILHISGRPVKSIRIFIALWFSFLLMIEAFFLILVLTSKLNCIFPLFIPPAMCVLGYLLCNLFAKTAFKSVVKAIHGV